MQSADMLLVDGRRGTLSLCCKLQPQPLPRPTTGSVGVQNRLVARRCRRSEGAGRQCTGANGDGLFIRVSFCRLVLVGRSRAVEHVKREHWRGTVTSWDQRCAAGKVVLLVLLESKHREPRSSRVCSKLRHVSCEWCTRAHPDESSPINFPLILWPPRLCPGFPSILVARFRRSR